MAAGDSKVIGVGRYEDSERKKDVENIVNQSNKKKTQRGFHLRGQPVEISVSMGWPSMSI